MIMHPMKPAMDGKNVGDQTDPDGKKLFQDMVGVVKASGSGFVHYQWPKAGSDTPQPKVSYVAGYAPWGWVVGSGIYVDDVDAAATSAALPLAAALLAAGLFTCALSYLLVRSVLAPVRGTLAEAQTRLSDNDVSFRFALGTYGREIDGLHGALNVTMARIESMVDGLRETSDHLDAQAGRLAEASETMDGAARGTASQADLVVDVMGQVSRNVDTVSAGTEEMGASIRAIADNAQAAAGVAAAAVDAAHDSTQAVQRLGQSSMQINDVVQAITAIAGQTNLLALNATIEAARAGEAGKGFAVVANEVKDLAQESAKATEDITDRVSAMQGDVTSAVEAIDMIARIIGEINDYQSAITAAVEEQNATTTEMSRSAATTARQGRDATDAAQDMAGSARSTLEQVARVADASTELMRISGGLRTLVAQYRS